MFGLALDQHFSHSNALVAWKYQLQYVAVSKHRAPQWIQTLPQSVVFAKIVVTHYDSYQYKYSKLHKAYTH